MSTSLRSFALLFTFSTLLVLVGGPARAQSSGGEGYVAGTAVDAETGRPLPGVNVLVEGTERGASTGPQGRFQIGPLDAGAYTIQARFVGYAPLEREVRVAAGDTARMRFSLSPRTIQVEEVVVSASRSNIPLDEISQAVDVVSASAIERQSDGVQIDNALNLVPGLRSFNRMGTDDSRFVLRGQGARNSWGINGVEVLVDGIPLGGLSGNTRTESLSANAIERIEIIRGPSSVWGGESIGGVINFITRRPRPGFHNAITLRGGSFGSYQIGGRFTGLTENNIGYAVTTDWSTRDGFRAHNDWRSLKANGNLYVPLLPDRNGELRVFAQVNRNVVEEPGAVTKEQAKANPEMANAFEAKQDRGRLDSRGRFGTSFDIDLTPSDHLNVAAFVTGREIDHPLGYAYLDIASNQTYLRAKWNRAAVPGFFGLKHSVLVGAELQTENQETAQRENNEGARGAEQAHTKGFAWDVGLFVQDHIQLSERLTATIGGRYDRLDIDVDDRFHPDDKDALNALFDELTFQGGMNYQLTARQMVYASVGQTFAPPTVGQVADARRYADERLEPQTALNYEVGSRGSVALAGRPVRYDLALYTMQIENFINRVEVRENFYVTTNEEATRQSGVEVGLGVPVRANVDLNLSYAYQHHTFTAGTHEGNQLPGVPRHQGSGEFVWRRPASLDNLSLSGQVNWTGMMYVDDAHELTNDGFSTLDLRLQYDWQSFEFGFRVANVWNERYVPDIDVNPQFGTDVFNPAPPRNVQASVTWEM